MNYRHLWNPTTVWISFLAAAILLRSARANYVDLTPFDFHTMATTGQVDLMIDVRSNGEWSNGHIENATHLANLHSTLSSTSDVPATLKSLGIWPCRQCTTVVYCNSGARAANALRTLQDYFEGPLYNGKGVSQWKVAGYELVDTSSANPPCTTMESSGTDEDEDDAYCELKDSPSPTTSSVPTPLPGIARQKEVVETKCGSVLGTANEEMGGQAAEAKGCVSRRNHHEDRKTDLGSRKRMRLRGL